MIFTIFDYVKTRARYIRGTLQILNDHPELRDIVEDDKFYLRDFRSRAKEFLRWVQDSPIRFPVHFMRFVAWELFLFLGKRDYKKNRENQSWEPIKSTK